VAGKVDATKNETVSTTTCAQTGTIRLSEQHKVRTLCLRRSASLSEEDEELLSVSVSTRLPILSLSDGPPGAPSPSAIGAIDSAAVGTPTQPPWMITEILEKNDARRLPRRFATLLYGINYTKNACRALS
jgi:hypothetical protein